MRTDAERLEVLSLRKKLAAEHPDGELKVQLWHVEVKTEQGVRQRVDLQCDHGRWRLEAIWTTEQTGVGA